MLKPKSNSFYFLFVFVTLCLVISACGTPVPQEATLYIGTFANAPESARIAVVIENYKFIVLISSLDDEFNKNTSRWFVGDLEGDGTVDGRGPDGVKVNGSIIYDSFTGIVTNAQGKVITFQGEKVPFDGAAGLYRGIGEYEGQPVIAGAIIEQGNSFVTSTVQVQDSVQFITPLVLPPFRVNDTNIILTVGDSKQKIDLFIVDSLVGIE